MWIKKYYYKLFKILLIFSLVATYVIFLLGPNKSKTYNDFNFIQGILAVIERGEISEKKYNTVMEFSVWKKRATLVCSNNDTTNTNFIGYNNMFVYMSNVFVNTSKFKGPMGDEEISMVLNQKEEKEYLELSSGAFMLNCSTHNRYHFAHSKHLAEFFRNTTFGRLKFPPNTPIRYFKGFTIAVTRYEYVNLYHTMTDYYNAYLMMNFFKKDPSNTRVLIIDSHPHGSLDDPWRVLFKNYARLPSLKGTCLFEEMVWSITGYESPLYVTSYSRSPPLPEEFRSFFLSSYDVSIGHVIDCSAVNIALIWRHDYVAHPRNPTGFIVRKIANENNITMALQRKFPKFNITGAQMDILPMRVQLEIISKTDILIGMHGAGLTLATLLPKSASVIEFFPNYVTPMSHYEKISLWRKLRYLHWVNQDPNNELPHKYTRIPETVVVTLVEKALGLMNCL